MFKKLTAILLLVLSVPLYSQSIDFTDYNQAKKTWMTLKNYYSTTSYGYSTIYNNGASVGLQNLLGKKDNWLVEKVMNYTWDRRYNQYVPWPKTGTIQQINQAPKVTENRVVAAYYFIQHKNKNLNSRMVVWLNSGNSLRVYYKTTKEGQLYSHMLRQDLDKNLKADSIYKGKVLEYNGTVGFYQGVDDLRFSWNDFIFDAKAKSKIVKSVDGFINRYDRDTWKKHGLPMNRGVLFYGPPGTGKSFIGKVIISNIFKKSYKNKITYIHVSARHVSRVTDVRNIYQIARHLSPTVVFFEDVDLIAGTDRTDRADVKNELMQQLSGLEKLEGVLTIGTTNYFELIDPALTRSKRLGFHYEVGLPMIEERVKLLELFSGKSKVDGVDFYKLANKLEGMTGADIKELVDLAIEKAYREGKVDRGTNKVELSNETITEAIKFKKSHRL